MGRYTRFENYVPELMPASAPPDQGFSGKGGPSGGSGFGGPSGQKGSGGAPDFSGGTRGSSGAGHDFAGPDFGAPGGFDPTSFRGPKR